MKKIILFFTLLSFPFYVLAYSKYIIPGGETIGIDIKSNGIMIVGLYKVDKNTINEFLKPGDKIIKIANHPVDNIEKLTENIEKYNNNGYVDITYLRNNKLYTNKLKLIEKEGIYKTGLYVKDSILGIGTLTYIDPETSIYGTLGHVINESKTNEKVEVRDGSIYNAEVKGFTRSSDGNPGSKNALINKENIIGDIKINSQYGVFGNIKNNPNKEKMEIASLDEVSLGKAYIYTTDNNNEIKKYEIKIIDISKGVKEKNIYFEIISKELLELSGGIVQGMSGSPIIQKNRIIGAVTRVVVDDVSKGYGISIITMLEEGDKIK